METLGLIFFALLVIVGCGFYPIYLVIKNYPED